MSIMPALQADNCPNPGQFRTDIEAGAFEQVDVSMYKTHLIPFCQAILENCLLRESGSHVGQQRREPGRSKKLRATLYEQQRTGSSPPRLERAQTNVTQQR